MRATLSRFRVFALREFRTHWRRAVASMVVVAVSCALLVAILGIFGSLTISVDRMSAALAESADLEVAGAPMVASMSPSTLRWPRCPGSHTPRRCCAPSFVRV